jgi:hypothetical protein
MVRFVHDAYGLPEASDAQLDRIDQQLRSLELERAQRIKAQHAHAAPNRPRTGPPAWRHLPAYHSAPDALAEPGGFEDDDKSIHHPPPPGEDAHQYSVKPASRPHSDLIVIRDRRLGAVLSGLPQLALIREWHWDGVNHVHPHQLAVPSSGDRRGGEPRSCRWTELDVGGSG